MEKGVLKLLIPFGDKAAASNLIFVCLQILLKPGKWPKLLKESIRLDLSVNLGTYITVDLFSAMTILQKTGTSSLSKKESI